MGLSVHIFFDHRIRCGWRDSDNVRQNIILIVEHKRGLVRHCVIHVKVKVRAGFNVRFDLQCELLARNTAEIEGAVQGQADHLAGCHGLSAKACVFCAVKQYFHAHDIEHVLECVTDDKRVVTVYARRNIHIHPIGENVVLVDQILMCFAVDFLVNLGDIRGRGHRHLVRGHEIVIVKRVRTLIGNLILGVAGKVRAVFNFRLDFKRDDFADQFCKVHLGIVETQCHGLSRLRDQSGQCRIFHIVQKRPVACDVKHAFQGILNDQFFVQLTFRLLRQEDLHAIGEFIVHGRQVLMCFSVHIF